MASHKRPHYVNLVCSCGSSITSSSAAQVLKDILMSRSADPNDSVAHFQVVSIEATVCLVCMFALTRTAHAQQHNTDKIPVPTKQVSNKLCRNDYSIVAGCSSISQHASLKSRSQFSPFPDPVTLGWEMFQLREDEVRSGTMLSM